MSFNHQIKQKKTSKKKKKTESQFPRIYPSQTTIKTIKKKRSFTKYNNPQNQIKQQTKKIPFFGKSKGIYCNYTDQIF